jgi:hypothetical protein
MEAKKILNKIKKLKPTNENIKIKDKKDKVYDAIKEKHQKIYNLKIDIKN